MADAGFWSVRLGELLTFVGFCITGLLTASAGYFVMKGSIQLLTQQLVSFKETYEKETEQQNKKIDAQGERIEKLNELVSLKMAYEERFKNQDERFNNMQRSFTEIRKEISELKHGDGFIGMRAPSPA